MTFEEFIRRVSPEVKKMRVTQTPDADAKIIKFRKKLELIIEIEKNLDYEEMKYYPDEYSLYVVRDGKDVDGISAIDFTERAINKELKYLFDCYFQDV